MTDQCDMILESGERCQGEARHTYYAKEPHVIEEMQGICDECDERVGRERQAAEKIEALKARVFFQFPVNTMPGTPEHTAICEAYAEDPHSIKYIPSAMTFADLEGLHTWRNAYIGDEMQTIGIRPSQWDQFRRIKRAERQAYLKGGNSGPIQPDLF